ncbi:MAG: hypothetical protein ACPGYX_05475, partial [Oceanobacter sp.]
MTETQIILLLGYVALAGLLLLAIIHGRLPWLLKLALVLASVGFYWLSYVGWQQSQGWPSATLLPDKFLLHFSVIDEPDDQTGSDGAIFIWATNLQGDQLAEEPRAYRMP